MSDGGFGGGVASSISMTALDDDDAGLFISRGGVVNSNSKEGFIRLIAAAAWPIDQQQTDAAAVRPMISDDERRASELRQRNSQNME